MHYSILPIIYPEESPEYVELQYNGCNVLARVSDEGYILERLHSYDYMDFMNNDFAPGTLLNSTLID